MPCEERVGAAGLARLLLHVGGEKDGQSRQQTERRPPWHGEKRAHRPLEVVLGEMVCRRDKRVGEFGGGSGGFELLLRVYLSKQSSV